MFLADIPLNIDWQQILLHLLNFVILVGGLYLLLFSPVKKFMAKRKAHYEEMDKEANLKLAEANKKEEEINERLAKLNEELTSLRSKTSKDMEEYRQTQIVEAQKEATNIITNANKLAAKEKNRIVDNANKEIKELIKDATKKVVDKSKNNNLDEFIKAIEGSDSDELH